jgi:hypothetical protein
MRTIRTKVYKFNELTQQGKDKAIERYRNNNADDIQTSSDEIIDSAKAAAELFNLKFGREYTDIRTGHIDDNILELSGIRLYKYILNHYYISLFTPKYIRSIDRPVKWKAFICKVHKGQSGEYTQIFSKLERDNSCVLTGVSYDNDILQPVYDFLSYPNKATTFSDLITDIEHAIGKTFQAVEEWMNSREYIIETIVNNEYEFTIDGRMI